MSDSPAIVYYDFNSGLMQEECFKQLFETCSDATPSGETILGGLRNLEGAGRASKMTQHL